MQAILPLNGQLTRTSWQLPPNLTFEQWVAAGEILGQVESGTSWWIGDWWRGGKPWDRQRTALVQSEEWPGPTYGTCRNCGSIAEKFEELSRRHDSLTFNHHVEVAGLDAHDADHLLDRCEQIKAETGQAPTIRELRNWVIEFRRQQKINLIASGALAWPTARFPVIYADPPWQYEFSPTTSRAIENHYPTIELAELCAWPVAERLATDDAILFLWATAPKLDQAAGELIKAWGFTYRTNFVWVKDKTGMGYYARNQHEHLLVGVRGEMPPPAQSDRVSSVLTAPRGEHSVKPTEFYHLIEDLYPELPKVELFARQHRSGWSAIGNQLPAIAA